MKKVLLLVWLALLGLAENHAQAQCRDSVMWDKLSLNRFKCCWTIEPGSKWLLYTDDKIMRVSQKAPSFFVM